jgi:hypothetical protein
MRTNRSSLLIGGTALLGIAMLSGCKPVGPDYNKPGYRAPEAYKETGASSVAPVSL